MTRVLIADSHPLVILGIEALLRGSDFEIVGKVRDGIAAMAAVKSRQPDIVVLDAALPLRSGIEVVRSLRSRDDGRCVVLLTAGITDAEMLEALDLKVQGLVPKEGEHLLLMSCLKEVSQGRQWIERSLMQRAFSIARAGETKPMRNSGLTLRERAVAYLVTRGLRNREIGEELGIVEGTVKVTLNRMFTKLNIDNRVELAMLMRDSSLSDEAKSGTDPDRQIEPPARM
ncbi:response regulator transcription factor [Brevundimonas sp. Root1423]|uniref:response regulator n=1 Tax=Brevundimonas sp. Root1423 TaxID=1736462 RepID=UPI0006F3C00E|nr:response regulator transcription factor [Brevundimonas sp. Root1423]KQY75377.1 hypothetical protein ASD25_12645 [Brevundimonas sp. Root1423]